MTGGGPDADTAAIRRTVLDYFEGWFDGDPSRMRRALHSQLVKRSLQTDSSGRKTLRTITAEQMIDATRRGEGKSENQRELGIEIEIEQVLGELANVTVRSAAYIEYLHLARTTNGWKIVNDVWQPARGSAP